MTTHIDTPTKSQGDVTLRFGVGKASSDCRWQPTAQRTAPKRVSRRRPLGDVEFQASASPPRSQQQARVGPRGLRVFVLAAASFVQLVLMARWGATHPRLVPFGPAFPLDAAKVFLTIHAWLGAHSLLSHASWRSCETRSAFRIQQGRSQ